MLLKQSDAVQFSFHPEFVIPYPRITPACLLKVQARKKLSFKPQMRNIWYLA